MAELEEFCLTGKPHLLLFIKIMERPGFLMTKLILFVLVKQVLSVMAKQVPYILQTLPCAVL